jgi:hypothetical protein
MLANLFGKRAATAPPQPYRAENLTLRIKHANFLKALQAHGVPPEQMPLTRPLCGELLVSYAFETPEQFVMVTPAFLKTAGVAPQDVHGLALQALHRQVLGHGVRLVEDEGGYLLRIAPQDTSTHLEATCLLLDGIWDLLQDEIKPQGELLACVPTRDFFFVLDSAKPESHAHVREFARELMGKEEVHGLSLQLMTKRPEGLALWPTD